MNNFLRLHKYNSYKVVFSRTVRLFSVKDGSDGPQDPNLVSGNDLGNDKPAEVRAASKNETPRPRLSIHSISNMEKLIDVLQDTTVETKSNELEKSASSEDPRDKKSFATLLRESSLITLGNPQGRTVVGTIFEVMGDDLYIDFGGKFHCVCPRPHENPSIYRRGLKVRLKLYDTEISSRFLGASRDNTLLEADGTLLGPLNYQGRQSDDRYLGKTSEE